MNRINVLFLMPQMGIGGSERLVLMLADKLDKARFNPSIAWLTADEALPEFRSLGVPLHSMPKDRRIDLGLMRRLGALVRAHRIDVVNAQHFMPAIYAYYGCKMAGRRGLVFTAHSRWEVEDTSPKWRIAGGYMLRAMDASVGVTSDVTDAIRSVFHTSGEQTVAIENGVDTDLFRRSGVRAGLRAQLQLDDEEVVVGIVANLKEVKNHLFLLKAFAGVAKRQPRATLLVVGRGFEGEADNTEGEIRSFIRQNGLDEKVRLLGYRADIPDLLKAMDIFCLVSRQEGLPIGLIEAMSTHLPVIGTNVPGIRDVIAPDVDGLLVKLDDVGELEAALMRVIGDAALRERMGRAGREKATNRYSLQRCVAEYEALFTRVAG